MLERVVTSAETCAADFADYNEIRRLVGPELQMAYMDDGVGGCVPAEESQSAFYREIGDVVPLEQFVEFTGGP